jgi:hypothetical protein
MRAALLFAAVAMVTAAPAQSWIWQPYPSMRLDRRDCLGFTEDRILRLGLRKWGSYAYDAQQSKSWSKSRVRGVDGSTIVFGACLARRNDRIVRQTRPKEKARITSLRRALYRFGMACIALEDVFGGGGTYSIHAPRDLFADEEMLLYDLLCGKPYLNRSDLRAVIDARSRDLISWNQDRPTLLPFNDHIKPADVRLWARRATSAMRQCEKSAAALFPDGRARMRTFFKRYLIDYLDVRGAYTGRGI